MRELTHPRRLASLRRPGQEGQALTDKRLADERRVGHFERQQLRRVDPLRLFMRVGSSSERREPSFK